VEGHGNSVEIQRSK
jgi:hypothetical protein